MNTEFINRVEVQGIIGSIKVSNIADKSVARISVATNVTYGDSQGALIIETTWHNVTAWSGENIKDLDKLKRGSNVRIVGRLRTQKYTGADGYERSCTELLAQSLEVIS